MSITIEELEEVKIPLRNRLNIWLWFLQRFLGIVIILWMLLHTYTNFLIIQGPEIYEAEVAFYESIPGIQIIYILLGIGIAWHAFYGIYLIYSDLAVGRKEPYQLFLRELESKRKAPFLGSELSISKNFPSWFFSKRQLGLSRKIWAMHRIMAVIVSFVVLIHFIRLHLLLGLDYIMDWDKVILTFKDPTWLIFYIIFNAAISIHGANGIRIIITDFTSIEEEHHKFVLYLAVLIAIVGFVLLTSIEITAFLIAQQQ